MKDILIGLGIWGFGAALTTVAVAQICHRHRGAVMNPEVWGQYLLRAVWANLGVGMLLGWLR